MGKVAAIIINKVHNKITMKFSKKIQTMVFIKLFMKWLLVKCVLKLEMI